MVKRGSKVSTSVVFDYLIGSKRHFPRYYNCKPIVKLDGTLTERINFTTLPNNARALRKNVLPIDKFSQP